MFDKSYYEVKEHYNNGLDLELILDKKGKKLLVGKSNIEKYSIDNSVGKYRNLNWGEADSPLYDKVFCIYKIPQEYFKAHYEEEYNKLKALELLLDESKLNDILEDLNRQNILLNDIEENLLLFNNSLNEDNDLETIDAVGNDMMELSKYLP